jgi:hypothetical protein
LGSPIARRLDQLETTTDDKVTVVADAIRQVMTPPEPQKKRGIGFLARLAK